MGKFEVIRAEAPVEKVVLELSLQELKEVATAMYRTWPGLWGFDQGDLSKVPGVIRAAADAAGVTPVREGESWD